MLRLFCRPRYSLRTLLALILVSAVLTHAAVTICEHRHQRRRQHFVEDVRAQLVICQQIDPEYSRKLTSFVRRRIVASEAAGLISIAERKELMREATQAAVRAPVLHQTVVAQVTNSRRSDRSPASTSSLANE